MVLFTPDDHRGLTVEVGEVYLVPTDLYDENDPKEERRVVVVRVPTKTRPEVEIRTRTTDLDKPGRYHPIDHDVECDKPGRWQPHPYRIPHREFTEDRVIKKLGKLDGEALNDVLELYETGR